MPASDRLRDLQVLVDDDKDTREMLCFILQQAGGHAIADVIVSDIGMPGDNGYALIAQVRSVQSSSALGTTFTLHLPLDARPYQAA